MQGRVGKRVRSGRWEGGEVGGGGGEVGGGGGEVGGRKIMEVKKELRKYMCDRLCIIQPSTAFN